MKEITKKTNLKELSDIHKYAFFFDIDGTLTEFMDNPKDVTISQDLKKSLLKLQANNPAIAFISGRTIREIDHLFHPMIATAAGVHGAQIRYIDGEINTTTVNFLEIKKINKILMSFNKKHPEVIIENKKIAFAIHYRTAEKLMKEIHDMIISIVDLYPDKFEIQNGKFVYEIKPKNVSKGISINKIMKYNIFSKKKPIYIGDDITDESAFQAVNALQGISCKVGEGDTAAKYRFLDVNETIEWVINLINR